MQPTSDEVYKQINPKTWDAIVSGLDRAVRDADVLAPVYVNTIRPNRFFQAGVSIDSIDHDPPALEKIECPASYFLAQNGAL
jgi:hypothetical protein